MTSSPHHQTVTLDDGINDVAMTSLFHSDVIDDVIRTNRLLMTSSVTSWGCYDIINTTSSNCHFGGRTKNDVAMASWGHDDIIDDVISGQLKVSWGSLQEKSLFRVEEAELLRVPCTVRLN